MFGRLKTGFCADGSHLWLNLVSIFLHRVKSFIKNDCHFIINWYVQQKNIGSKKLVQYFPINCLTSMSGGKQK